MNADAPPGVRLFGRGSVHQAARERERRPAIGTTHGRTSTSASPIRTNLVTVEPTDTLIDVPAARDCAHSVQWTVSDSTTY